MIYKQRKQRQCYYSYPLKIIQHKDKEFYAEFVSKKRILF